MPYPTEYSSASAGFDRFLDAVKANAMLQTRHQAWQIARAVFLVFRDHLSTEQALRFADALPPLFRALFLEGLAADRMAKPFPDRAALNAQVAAVRRDHTLASDTSIDEVVSAFWPEVDRPRVTAALAGLPAGAARYWNVSAL